MLVAPIEVQEGDHPSPIRLRALSLGPVFNPPRWR